MSDIQITETIDKWMKNEHYHHPLKGCDLEHEGSVENDTIHIYKCLTHDKETSRGGWEWGWYGGEYNRNN